MPSITADEFDQLIHEGLPLVALFDFKVEALSHGRIRMRAPFQRDHIRPGGTVAGPVIMTLADCAMYGVVLSAIGRIELAVTTNLTIHFLRRPEPADLIADGKLLKLGRRLAVCEIVVHSDAHEDPVAHVTGTYSIPPQPSPTPAPA